MKILFLSLVLLSFGCGREVIREYVAVPGGQGGQGGGTGGTGGTGGKPSYQETQALLLTNCQSCHGSSSFLKSERGLRSSSAANRIRNRSMPPNAAALGDKERRLILSFF